MSLGLTSGAMVLPFRVFTKVSISASAARLPPPTCKTDFKITVYYKSNAYQLKNVCNIWGFPCGSAGKESACKAGDLGSIPGLGRSPGEGKGYPLQYSGLQNFMDCIVHGVAESQTQLSNLYFHLKHIGKIFKYISS